MKNSSLFNIIFISGLFILLLSCNETDLLPPVIELKGNDSLRIQLNSTYVDEGAKAIDETEGDISSAIFIDNPIDPNLVGDYVITYSVTDKSGNEAEAVYRFVTVYNNAEVHADDFQLHGTRVFPNLLETSSICMVTIDSSINNRLQLSDFCIGNCISIFADITDTNFIIPFQSIDGFEYTFNIQGMGNINDTLITTDCNVNLDSNLEVWQLNLNRIAD